MAQRRRKTGRKRKSANRPQDLGLIIGVIVLLLVAISIYLKDQSGFLGRLIGTFFFQTFGWTSYLVPILVGILLLAIYYKQFHGKLQKTILYLCLLFLCLSMISGIQHSAQGSFQTNLEIAGEKGSQLIGSGIFGAFFAYLFGRLIGSVGIYCLTAVSLLFFLLHLFEIPFSRFVSGILQGFSGFFQFLLRGSKELGSQVKDSIKNRVDSAEETPEDSALSSTPSMTKASLHQQEARVERIDREKPQQKIQIHSYQDLAPTPEEDFTAHPIEETRGETKDSMAEKPLTSSTEPTGQPERNTDDREKQMSLEGLGLTMPEEEELYRLPPLELLKRPRRSGSIDEAGMKQEAKTIEDTLASFGIESQVVSIQRGPTVTSFELKPQAGIKVSRITNLADDLALALAAPDIRIEAPIPGKPYVGIEVPNKVADSVSLREIIEIPVFQEEEQGIPVALGKSISGEPMIARIDKMPHLLIAGATGSGKSVCINTIITSILYKHSPRDVRLILIDPKVVELSVYNDIPHLLIPVVTDPKKASTALYKAVQEMERRFRLFSEYSVRDIKGYWEKQKTDEDMELLPYIVIIIDELSDLMMVASKDVEAHITRLAQMARACGMHLVIATQRPSVDVITGTIKANIPSRISFQVSSAIDSRTILDMGGAEKLLGKGDMLYYPASFSKPKRVQGAFISDQEVSSLVQFIKDRHQVRYDKSLLDSIEKETESGSLSSGEGEDERDSLMDEVLEFISHEDTTSISGLQRRFRIGYARAGRIIDDLEKMGAVSAQEGSKPRDVLIQEYDPEGGEGNEFTE